MSGPARAHKPPPARSGSAAPTAEAKTPAPTPTGPHAVLLPPVPLQLELGGDDVIQRDCGCGGTCAACQNSAEEEEEDLPGPGGFQLDAATPAAPANSVRSAHATAHDGTSGAADPLPFRDQIQTAFGHHDVSDVRTRTGGKAAQAARKLGANAYTRQKSIAFRERPTLRLAAHEAAHTVQQRRGVQLDDGIGAEGDAYEQQAEDVADAVEAGQSVETMLDEDPGTPTTTPANGPGVQRDCGCGGTCSACKNDQMREDDALQMELSVTPLPGAPEEEVPPAEGDAEPETEGLDKEVAKADEANLEDKIAEAEEANPDTAEEPAEPAELDGADGDEAAAAAPAGPADERSATETDIPAEESEADARSSQPEEEDTLQRVACGPTSEPADAEEPEEPPPGEVQEEAEAEGPSPADENEDPDALQNAVDDLDSADAAGEATEAVEADPAAAEAAMAEQGGTAQPAAALAGGASPMAAETQTAAATRDSSVGAYAASAAKLEEARAGAMGLSGMNARFDAGDQNRDDLGAANARIADFLSRSGSQIASQAAATQAEIDMRIGTALADAKQSLETAATIARAQIAAVIQSSRDETAARAEVNRGLIETQYSVSSAAVTAATTAALSGIDTSELETNATIDASAAAQAAPITAAYAAGERQVREAGRVVGAEAMDIAATYRSTYAQDRKVAGGECVEDSWYDGCLCDRRARARMTAADQVGEGYRDSLVQAAGEQADGMREGMPTDFANVAKMADKARETVGTQAGAMRAAVETRALAAQAALEASRASALAEIDATEIATLENLDALESSQSQSLEDLKFIQIAKLEETAHAAAAAAFDSVSMAVQSATSGVAMAVAGLTARTPPPEEELAAALAGLEDMLDGAMQSLSSSSSTALDTLAARIFAATGESMDAIYQVAQSAQEQASSMADSAGSSMATLASETVSRMAEEMVSVMTEAEAMQTAATATFTAIAAGLDANYAAMIGNLATGFTNSAEALESGLREALDGMRSGENSIPTKAAEAASKEKPAWQSVLKWVLIIAIVIVVAVVAGPAVIGAIGGLAAGMGASAGAAAFIGATVGGALLGAATGATIQVVNNVFDGNPWHEGVARAAAVGFVTGALGGAVGFGIGAAFQPAAQAGQAVARSLGSRALEFGANLAADATMEIGQQLIETGTVDWGNFGVAMAFSVGTAGLGEIPSVKAIQDGISGGVRDSVSGAVRSARGVDVNVDVRTDVDVDAGADVGPRIEAEADARPDVDADAPTRPPPDAGEAAPARPAEADAEATARADAEDAANPRVEDDGSIRDSDLSDASARAAEELGAPRLEAEPDVPARERSDSELAEAAEPVRIDGEDHTLVPRRWIDGEIRLFLCTDCGPILAKIDSELANPRMSDMRRQALTDLRQRVERIEADIAANGKTADLQEQIRQVTELTRILSGEVPVVRSSRSRAGGDPVEADAWAGRDFDDTPDGMPEGTHSVLDSPQRPLSHISDQNVGASKKLGQALETAGRPQPPGAYEAHHLVEAGDTRAQPARDVLAEHGIGLNEATNGAWLERRTRALNQDTQHPRENFGEHDTVPSDPTSIHSEHYIQRVNEILTDPHVRSSRENVLAALDQIRWALELGVRL